jgi:hypothetical protein
MVVIPVRVERRPVVVDDAGTMNNACTLLRLLTALSFILPASCATPRPHASADDQPDAAPIPVRATMLPGERLQFDFEPATPDVALEVLPAEDVRALLAEFLECVENPSQLSVVPALASSTRAPAAWEARLRAEFLARYGPGLLPLPDSLERSPLFMARSRRGWRS